MTFLNIIKLLLLIIISFITGQHSRYSLKRYKVWHFFFLKVLNSKFISYNFLNINNITLKDPLSGLENFSGVVIHHKSLPCTVYSSTNTIFIKNNKYFNNSKSLLKSVNITTTMNCFSTVSYNKHNNRFKTNSLIFNNTILFNHRSTQLFVYSRITNKDQRRSSFSEALKAFREFRDSEIAGFHDDRRRIRRFLTRMNLMDESEEDKQERLDDELLNTVLKPTKSIVKEDIITGNETSQNELNQSRIKFVSNIKNIVSTDEIYEAMYVKTEEHEEYLRRRIFEDDDLKRWDEYYYTPREGVDPEELKKEKQIEVAKLFNMLQNQKRMTGEMLSKTNRYSMTVPAEEIGFEDLTICDRIIDDEDDKPQDHELYELTEDWTKARGKTDFTNFTNECLRFTGWSSNKNALPTGYFYMNDEQAVFKDDYGGEEKSEVIRSIYLDTIKASTMSEEEQKKSRRIVSGYEFTEHFDISMVKKTPGHLGLLYTDTMDLVNANTDALRDDETKITEIILSDTTGDNEVKARPINKHVAYFTKPNATNLYDLNAFIQTYSEEIAELEKSEKEHTLLGRFMTWIGYPVTWRQERIASWHSFLEKREAYLKQFDVNKDFDKLNLTAEGEIPLPPIPDEYVYSKQGQSIYDKPAYFERRNKKHPERYDNSWYDLEVIALLEPRYNVYEHFTYIMFEIIEGVYALASREFESKVKEDYLPVEPITDNGWLDPSVGEMIQSNFAIVPGTRREAWYSLWWGRWDDTRFISDYQKAVDMYDDILKMTYKKTFWWDDYSEDLKNFLLWFDIFAHTFLLINGMMWFNPVSLFLYLFFCSIAELVTWN